MCENEIGIRKTGIAGVFSTTVLPFSSESCKKTLVLHVFIC